MFGQVGRDGSFTFRSVPPGDYRIGVSWSPGRGAAPAPGRAGSATVAVSGQDLEDVVVPVSTASSVIGRLAFDEESAARPATVLVSSIHLTPQATGFGEARVQNDGTFELQLIGPNLLRVRLIGSERSTNWFLESVTIDGRDVTDSGYDFEAAHAINGVEIILTQRMASVAGVVDDDGGRPVAACSVVAFSTDERHWNYGSRFLRSADADPDGRFSLNGLPAGEYFVVAVPPIEPGAETDPNLLARWRLRATRVTLGRAEAKSVALRLVG
jgi:hypothetical protein